MPEFFFESILKEAQAGARLGEIPVAAMIYESVPDEFGWRVIAFERNQTIAKKDPTAHAEMLAIRSASRFRKNERLPEAGLITTLEPCTMCSGAIIQARLKSVHYLAPGDHGPGLQYLLRKTRRTPDRFNHYPDTVLMLQYQDRYLEILQNFFRERRTNLKD